MCIEHLLRARCYAGDTSGKQSATFMDRMVFSGSQASDQAMKTHPAWGGTKSCWQRMGGRWQLQRGGWQAPVRARERMFCFVPPSSGRLSCLPFVPSLAMGRTGRRCFCDLDSSCNSEGPRPTRVSQLLSDPDPNLHGKLRLIHKGLCRGSCTVSGFPSSPSFLPLLVV